jgi:hypothetical protein
VRLNREGRRYTLTQPLLQRYSLGSPGMMRYQSRQRRRMPCPRRTQCRRTRLSHPRCWRICQQRKMCILLPMLPRLNHCGTCPPGKTNILPHCKLQRRHCTSQLDNQRMQQHHQPPPHLNICQPHTPYNPLIQLMACMSRPCTLSRCGRPQCTLRHTRSWLQQSQSWHGRRTRNRSTALLRLSTSQPRRPYKGRCLLHSCGYLARTENNRCRYTQDRIHSASLQSRFGS